MATEQERKIYQSLCEWVENDMINICCAIRNAESADDIRYFFGRNFAKILKVRRHDRKK